MPSPEQKTEKKGSNRRVIMLAVFIVVVIGGGSALFAYLAASAQTIYIDQAQIEAPVVDLSPTTSGVLNAVYVQEGDSVPAGAVVAEVGTELITTTAAGLVTVANNNIGKTVNPGDTVVEMIDPTQLRVVGQVEEDKGLASIMPGQRAVFTVDAFGGKQYDGIVDEVAPEAQSASVVFNISDQREEQNFDVKVRFDTTAYPELKEGMSARIWVYKN
jgi:multidrug resistance efflux pump